MKRPLALTMLLSVSLQPCMPQATSQAVSRIHGYVTNSVGLAVTSGLVKLTTDQTMPVTSRKFLYTFSLDGMGKYDGQSIAAGDYTAFLFQEGKLVDWMGVSVKNGDDKTVDFDMRRKSYLDASPPEQLAAIATYKEKYSAQIVQAQAAYLNQLLVQARADTQSKEYRAAEEAMAHATSIRPDAPLLWIALGDALLARTKNMADFSRSLDSDVSELDNVGYEEAADAYRKALALLPPSPSYMEQAAAASTGLGLALGREGKLTASKAALDQAVSFQPANTGMYLFDEAVIFFNAFTNRTTKSPPKAQVLLIVSRAIASNPYKANTYFMKAKVLLSDSQVVQGKRRAAPGLIEACKQYLLLAPTGAHAQVMQEILGNLQ